jgi:ketosteroid isomerase-like protein
MTNRQETNVMPNSVDPMAAVRQYIEAFNNGDESAMAAACADPMQILDGMSPHVWQGWTAAEDWWKDVLAEGEHFGASGYRITLDEPRHVDVNGDHAYVVAPASMTFELRGQQITQTGSVYTVALRKSTQTGALPRGRGQKALDFGGDQASQRSAHVKRSGATVSSRVLLTLTSLSQSQCSGNASRADNAGIRESGVRAGVGLSRHPPSGRRRPKRRANRRPIRGSS